MSLRADGNGGAPTSALRASTAAAAALRSSKRQGEELVDTGNSSSDFTGPQRVRVSNNNNPPDLSLSFWGLPAATPDSKTSRLKSKTVSRAARTTAGGGAAAVTPLHHHRQAPGVTPGEPSTATRDTIASSSRKNAAQHQSLSRAGASTRKRARPDAVPAAAAATDQAAAAAQQASKGSGRGVGTSGAADGGKESSATAAASSSTSAAVDSSLSFGTDISHILNWKPAPRPSASASSTANGTSTATAALTASANRLGGKEEGGAGGSEAAGHQQRRQLVEQPTLVSAAVKPKQEPTAASTSLPRPASASSAGASGGPSLGVRASALGEGPQAGARSRPTARVTATPAPPVSGVNQLQN